MQVISAFCRSTFGGVVKTSSTCRQKHIGEIVFILKKLQLLLVRTLMEFFQAIHRSSSGGCKNCIRRFQTLKIFFFCEIKIRISIFFGFWAKTFQPLNKLSAFWQKNFDKVVKTDFYLCRTTFGRKRCFFLKKISFVFYKLRTKKIFFWSSCQKFFFSVVTNSY